MQRVLMCVYNACSYGVLFSCVLLSCCWEKKKKKNNLEFCFWGRLNDWSVGSV